MLIDMNDLPPTLRVHIAALRGLVKRALEDFLKDHKMLRARYCARTEASLIHDNMVWYAKLTGLAWKLRRNLFLLRVDRDYAVKPKKLDNRLRPRNIQTQLVLDFDRQRAIRLFDDLDLTHLYLGYQLDGAELLTASIWLVCPEGKGIRWAAELRDEPASAAVDVAVPAAPTMPPASDGKRVKRKPDVKKDVPKTEASNE